MWPARMATAWLFTLPVAALVGAGAYGVDHGIGGNGGDVVLLAVLLAIVGAIVMRSRRAPVHHANVNDDWDGDAGSERDERATASVSGR